MPAFRIEDEFGDGLTVQTSHDYEVTQTPDDEQLTSFAGLLGYDLIKMTEDDPVKAAVVLALGHCLFSSYDAPADQLALPGKPYTRVQFLARPDSSFIPMLREVNQRLSPIMQQIGGTTHAYNGNIGSNLN